MKAVACCSYVATKLQSTMYCQRTPCKTSSGKNASRCWQHQFLTPDKMKSASVYKTGRSSCVYTLVRGTLAHDYVILPTRTRKRLTDKPYWVGIMAPEVGMGLGSFVNAPYTGPMYQANCAFKFDATIQCPVIYALRDIWPGEELYMAYGRGKRGSRAVVANNETEI